MDLVDAETAEKILDSYAELSPNSIHSPTFMEITKYPHYENVCSNVLAFFLDPKGPHKLGTLMLDALSDAGGIAKPNGAMLSSTFVRREARTNQGNWIDLLIGWGDCVFLIENKIDPRAANPFDDYAAYLEEEFSDLEKHKFVISIKSTDAGREWGFTNFRHEDFVRHVRLILGQYIAKADTRYLTFFLDFLNTLDNLRKGISMDRRLVQLFAQQYDEIRDLLSTVEKFKEDLRLGLKDLRTLADVEAHKNVEYKPVRTPLSELYEGLAYVVTVPRKLGVYAEIRLFPAGWQIWMKPHNSDYAALIGLLRKLEIPFEEYEEDGGVTYEREFVCEYDESLGNVSELFRGLIDKLATAGVKNR